MSWPLRALIGPMVWAFAFALIYALHGIGCAQGWPVIALPVGGSLHHMVLISVWGMALALGVGIVIRAPKGQQLEARICRAGAWIGVVSVMLTLFPVLGLSSCDIP